MGKTYKVTLVLEVETDSDEFDGGFNDTVKEALLLAVDLDDTGDESLNWQAEEVSSEEDF